MARYGSERIRGHGIPEAMETILVGGSKVEARLAVLKPISSAICIGTGGPFGAEGPIIMTGGCRRVARRTDPPSLGRRAQDAPGGRSRRRHDRGVRHAGGGHPIRCRAAAVRMAAAIAIPVAVASVLAAALRMPLASAGLLGGTPLFPVPPHPEVGIAGLGSALVLGVAGGLLAWLLTACVYGAEDLFQRLPMHWMWWPAIGGVVVGSAGSSTPGRSGSATTPSLRCCAGTMVAEGLLLLLVVKLVIWSVALGSGTSGGILAPLLILGCALGGVLAPGLPGGTAGMWSLVCMAATMAGVTRSPLTAILFAFELTHDQGCCCRCSSRVSRRTPSASWSCAGRS